ncbi:MAG: UvrB/UvrC motif-containing protein [Oscillospiraceae bacterium]|nr:UvrB/UvrC motif-containing protein [Candidatus Equicaccousia limihippi]
MLCEKCGILPATTYYKQIINGKETELHLCSECAKDEGIYGFSAPDLFSSFFGSPIASSLKICPTSKTSFQQIKKRGRVGCSDCYKYFEKELMPSIVGMHGHTKHVGFKPLTENSAAKTDTDTTEKQLQKLKIDLEKAVKEERYEDAATIRDKIKEITKED